MSCSENKNQIYDPFIGGIAFAVIHLILSYIWGDFSWLPGILGGTAFILVGLAYKKLKSS